MTQRRWVLTPSGSSGRIPRFALPRSKEKPRLEELRFVEAMNAAIVAPGHGVVDTTAGVAQARQHLEELRDAAGLPARFDSATAGPLLRDGG